MQIAERIKPNDLEVLQEHQVYQKPKVKKNVNGMLEPDLAILSLLNDPTRYKILALLISTSVNLCVNDISGIIGISQSATSHQLNRLEDIGVVRSVRYGRKICYIIENNEMVGKIKKIMDVIK